MAFIVSFDDTKLLGGMGLGQYFYVFFMVTVVNGVNIPLITFVSQLKGMGKYPEMGYYVNCTRMIVLISSVPVCLCFVFSKEILVLL
jgi:Na+-driven multidrug efflux pump